MNIKPVTIAVIADTHAKRLDDLPGKVLEALARVDVIVHLGDFTSPQLITDLERKGRFYGIWGNHDRLPEIRQRLKRMEVVEIAGKRLGLIHGLFDPVARLRRLKYCFKDEDVDILLFAHSHLITQKMLDGVFLFNPGTVSSKFPASQGSFGILTLDGSIKSEIIILDKTAPVRWKWLWFLPAALIRYGTIFLEAWPYIDFSSWNFFTKHIRQYFKIPNRKTDRS